METVEINQTIDPGRIMQSDILQVVAPTCNNNSPFALSGSNFGLMDYAKILGTPVGKTGAMVGSLICNDDHCSRGVILAIAMAAGWYGWTRKDVLGYGLMASAVGAAVYTLFDPPKISVV